jgi:general secretion pathway protein L
MRGNGVAGLLVAAVPVRVLGADGQESIWLARGTMVEAKASARTGARFRAVELPEESVLLRTLQLPALSDEEVAQAVKLEAEGASPFPSSDLAWGYRALPSRQGSLTVSIAMASRLQVLAHLASVGAQARPGPPPEVWSLPEGAPPIVLTGFGEGLRLAQSSFRQQATIGLLVVAGVLALLIAATPALQLRFRALEAVAAYDASVKRAEPLLRQRANLSAAGEKVDAIKAVLAERSDPLYVMALLTEILPDDTSLLGVQIQGSKVSINGLTTNAAALMQQLGSRPELRDVKAPTAATRSPGSPKDVFNIEFTLNPKPAPANSAAAGATNVPADGGVARAEPPRPAASAAAPAASVATPAAAPALAASAPTAAAIAPPAPAAAAPPAAAAAPGATPAPAGKRAPPLLGGATFGVPAPSPVPPGAR